MWSLPGCDFWALGEKVLKILLVHNYYGSSAPSGENQVFDAEHELLRKYGHDVEVFTRSSDGIRAQGVWGLVKGALATSWNPLAAYAVREAVEKMRPDVVHVHNTFPLISPSIFHAVGRRAARVMTLHNYRLFCPAAIPLRDGRVCTECLDKKSVLPALQYGCYRGSRVATIPLALSVALHRALHTWQREVDAFIAFSEFQREVMTSAGLPSEKVFIKPNFYPGRPAMATWDERGNYVVFAGRLTPEKGVVSLLRAWAAWGSSAPELRIVGEGELRPELELMAKGLPVRFLGQLSSGDAQEQIASARLLVLPSECFEGFPMVVREAFAFGTPVAASSIGPLPSIVQKGISGVLFNHSSPDSLLAEVRRLWEAPGLLERLGRGGRAEFEEKFSEGANYSTLIGIYERAIHFSRSTA